jgi:hypothetical protein
MAPQSNILAHGSLTVEVRIKPDKGNRCRNFIPKNRFVQNMQRLLLDEKTPDISFQVQTQVFYAHMLVFKVCEKGSVFAFVCKDSNESLPVPILDVNHRLFWHIFCHI